jgi:inner membrane protein
MKKWSLFYKVGALFGLTLLMLIPVTMIMEVVDERHYYQLDVVDKITESAGGKQFVVGPILVQPYIEYQREVVKGKVIITEYLRQKYILPENLAVNGDLKVEKRKLGIYDTQVYKGDITFTGQLPSPEMSNVKDKIALREPYLVVAVMNPAGIISVPQLTINQQPFNFSPGVGKSRFSKGVHAVLPVALSSSKNTLDFKFTLSLQGSQSLSVVPVGKTTTYDLTANWPHANFIGKYLPIDKNITDSGFSASWQSSWFANNINDRFERLRYEGDPVSAEYLPSFDVNLIELVDEYQLNQRSVKYAVLFIGLTFIAFFLFEVMKGLRIHPIQYLLVGTALALFYLILLALSEHIGFNLAYGIAALACSGLISFYLSAVLRGLLRGLTFGLGLLVLYGVLFGLLQSENTALLLGSLVLFLILAIIMTLTRKLDWYNFSASVNSGGGVSEIDEAAHSELSEEIDRKSCRLWK